MSSAYNKFLFTITLLIIFSGSFIKGMDQTKQLFQSNNDTTAVTQNNNVITNQRQNIITNTVQKVSPAIVGINVTEIRQVQDPFSNLFNDPFFRQFFGNQQREQKVKSLGSGYIISSDGYILTNDHVAGNGTEITVTMTNGEHYPAKLIGSDQTTDICLLKIDQKNLPYVNLGNSDDIIIGEWVIALGNPFGLFELNDQPTVTVGVISATGMNLEPIENRYYLNMIQTDAAINSGNSGGALVNSIGEVIGMNTLIFSPGGTQGNIGLGFAIPINKVKRIAAELKDKGKIDRDFNIGMGIQSIDEGIAQYYKLNTTKGVIVTQIINNSPSSKAGLKPGDIITKINDYSAGNENIVRGIFAEFRAGETITLHIIRDNIKMDLKMKLEKK